MQTEMQIMATTPEQFDINIKITAGEGEKIFDLLKQARAALVAQGCTPRPVKYGNGNGNGNGHSAPHPAEAATPKPTAANPAQDTAKIAEAQPEPVPTDPPKPEQSESPDQSKATPPARPTSYRSTPKRQA